MSGLPLDKQQVTDAASGKSFSALVGALCPFLSREKDMGVSDMYCFLVQWEGRCLCDYVVRKKGYCCWLLVMLVTC